jgi:[ribosomal protein S18]-alanine N-acetyltransferase
VHEISIRPMTAEDIGCLERILNESPQAAKWSASEFVHLLQSEIRLWVADKRGKTEGLIAWRAAAGEAEILNLAISQSQRRQGMGRQLLLQALNAAAEGGASSIFLEVREFNYGARAFYASAGFKESYRRRLYYRDPDEDALVLTLSVCE